jgi:diguanylate cyclase (GGDEF)-like protein
VSPILSHLAAAAVGILATLAVLGPLLRRQHRAQAAAEYHAHHDSLTGLANRRGARAYLRTVLARGDQVGVVLFDLDRFKHVNDTPGVGHKGGDALLRDIARLLAALPAPVRLAARLGGDEFVVIVHAHPDRVAAVAHEIWQLVTGAPFTIAGHRFDLGASVGHASSQVGLSAGVLLHCADLAMYNAKKAGGGVAAYPLSPPDDEVADRPAQRCREPP